MRKQRCLTLLRISNDPEELPLNCIIPFMSVWNDSGMLCSLCWHGRTLERPSLLTRSNDLLVSELSESEVKGHRSAALCTCSGVVKWRIQCLRLTLQLGSQTLCKILDPDTDDPSKYFFDDGQKTEISISREISVT